MNRVRIIKRGRHKGETHVFIGAWVPAQMKIAAEAASKQIDCDMSKLLRTALEEKVSRELQPVL